MFLRLIGLLLVLLAAPAFGAGLPFVPCDLYPAAGPRVAQGALVWLPGTYGRDQPGPPDPPDLVARLAAKRLDVFEFLRPRDNDPLAGGGQTLARGLAALRARGYRRIVIAGHSRGAWIALTAIAHPGLADAIVAVSVAAHGTRPDRQAQARADWRALWASARRENGASARRGNGASARRGPMRIVLVQLRDDPYDPTPGWRLEVARANAARAGLHLLSIFLPQRPSGHIGVYDPAFDEDLGGKIADFVNLGR